MSRAVEEWRCARNGEGPKSHPLWRETKKKRTWNGYGTKMAPSVNRMETTTKTVAGSRVLQLKREDTATTTNSSWREG